METELSQSEKDQITWHVNKGFLTESQGEEFLKNPTKARMWLRLEVDLNVREEE